MEKTDVIIIGAGPVGIAFACSLSDTKLKVAIIDKLPKKIIENPKIDGREIVLTHHSIKVLKKLNVWRYISNNSISVIFPTVSFVILTISLLIFFI